jgi:hypothetical protein
LATNGDFGVGTTNDIVSPELPPSPPSPQMTSIPEENADGAKIDIATEK